MKKKINLLLIAILSIIFLITVIGAVTIILQHSPSGTGNYGINATTDASLYSHLNTTSDVPYNSLVGYWSFDGDTSTSAYDWSGNGRTGALTNTPTRTNCVYENCYTYNGVNQYTQITGYKGVTGTTARSVSLWFKTADTRAGGANPLIVWGDGNTPTCDGGGLLFAINMENGYPYLRASANTANGTGGFNNNAWHHLVYTLPASSTSSGSNFYMDGVLLTKSSTGSDTINTQSDQDTKIGAGTECGSGTIYFNGTIDEVMIFNTALNSSQITDIYNNQSSRFYSRGEIFYPQTNLTLSAGDNSFNISIQGLNKTLGSNAQLRMGEWFYNSSTASARNYLNENQSAYANFDGVNDYVSTPITTQFTD